jgi:hypothetical protein
MRPTVAAVLVLGIAVMVLLGLGATLFLYLCVGV